MSYLLKNVINHQKNSIDFNSKPKKHQISFSSMIFRSNLMKLNGNSISPPSKNIEGNQKFLWINNYHNIYKTNEDFDINDDKSTSNLTSTGINNESTKINNSIKKPNLYSSKNIKNINLKQHLIIDNITTDNNYYSNIIDTKKKSLDSLSIYTSQNNRAITSTNKYNNENNNNNNDKEIKKRCRHKKVKREIYLNNNNGQNNKLGYSKKINIERNSNKKIIESKLNSKEYKNKSITIPINKRIKDNNFFNNTKKNKSLLNYLSNKTKFNKKSIKTSLLENYKENKENIEINDNKNICYIKRNIINCKVKRIKSPQNYNNNNGSNINNRKTNSISKYKNTGKILESRYYKIISKKIVKKENNSDIYFNENELNENILSITTRNYTGNKSNDQMINKVLHFKTECNGIFNQNQNKGLNNNKIQSLKNLKEKKESSSTVISSQKSNNDNKDINKEENDDIKNIKNIIKNNLDYNINKKNILRKNSDSYQFQKLQKYNTNIILDNDFLQKPNKDLNIQKNKEENLIINPEFYSSENSKTNSLTINREFKDMRKRFKSINLNMQTKKQKSLRNKKNMFYEIIKNGNVIKIFFSFCENDITLLNKMTLISKDIYKKIKPLIYQKISSKIFKFNENKNTRNKIKKYLMKNNSSLMKLSPAILRKKYTDLIFENNNKYDNDIKKDLTRTFPDNILFKYGNTYYNKLYHILTAYSNFNKNIGYIQGLNFLAAQIIYFFEDEIDAFSFLDVLIHKFDLDKILDNNLNNIFLEKKLENINSFISKKLPKLNKFLSGLKLSFEFFITNWILTLFSDSMDNEYLTIVWDFMCIFGWKFFKYFILNILILCENDILNSTQNNLTFIKKHIIRNENFKNNFHKLIKDTVQTLINDEIII